MDFIQINVQCDAPFGEILTAEMGELGFTSFVETELGFEAYIEEEEFSHPAVQTLFNNYRKQTRIWYELKKIPKVNWNEEWEKNYDPINVDDKIYVRATFHESKPAFDYEIVINPKMSFGTGHHETTHQMLALQYDIDHKDKSLIDIGSGTGILAIMGAKLGAKSVAATDVDEWCIENSQDNFDLNEVKPEFIKKGTIHQLALTETYDIVLANINTNVLLEEIPEYVKILNSKGHLFLSGFYETDLPQVNALVLEHGLVEVKHTTRKNWVAIVYQKVS
ncbi:50S ribosomal protein L11 methyltransferase [Roseivirga misakiensis]|uniref:Ribosomal protein L11 methyltransferase n=1 Tax=Roseivirga misakiensis TaxID=1563681 RepID=A0A1E5T7T3_9BACT|nr:50S ribosomal protein L11 methyltransferase [Roseivirga misakiensis]OEK07444.1 ribosomal protein L11 methyltransferase [Roseivirga misakiensis]